MHSTSLSAMCLTRTPIAVIAPEKSPPALLSGSAAIAVRLAVAYHAARAEAHAGTPGQ